MGKKRQGHVAAAVVPVEGPSNFWCYYCNSEARDEPTLIQHQAAKHFACPWCDKNTYGRLCLSLGGLIAHVRRSHRKVLDKVPGAIEGRDSPAVDVYGMTGIPQEALDEHREREAANVIAESVRDDHLMSMSSSAVGAQLQPLMQPPKTAKPQSSGSGFMRTPQAPVAGVSPPAPSAGPKQNTPKATPPSTTDGAATSAELDGITKAFLAAAASNTAAPALEGALLAAVATNTPEGIITALKEATAWQSSEPPPAAPAPRPPSPDPEEAPPQEQAPQKRAEKVTAIMERMAQNAKVAAESRAAAPTIEFKAKSFGVASKEKKASGSASGKVLALPQGAFLDRMPAKPVDAKDEERLFIGGIPVGTTEEMIRLECAKYGAVASVFYDSHPENGLGEPWALVTYVLPEKVPTAVSRLNRRLGVFDATQPMEVRVSNQYDFLRMEGIQRAEEDKQRALEMALQEPPPMEEQREGRRHDGRRHRRSYDSRSRSYEPAYQEHRPLPPKKRKVYGLGGFDNAASADSVRIGLRP